MVNSPTCVLDDFQDCLKKSRMWTLLPFYDIKARYRRTLLGPFWLTLGTAISIFGMGLVWGSIFNVPLKEFFPYITAGMIIWIFIASILNEGCSVFISQNAIIHNIKLSFFVHIMTMISRNTIIFLHNLIVVFLVFIFFKHPLNFSFLLFFPGFFLLVLNSFWVSLLLGIFATRYRDVNSIVSSLTTLIMFATPIMWTVDRLPENRQLIASLNPFYHMLSLVREPILGKIPSLESYGIILSLLIVGFSLSLWAYKKFIHRIVFWM